MAVESFAKLLMQLSTFFSLQNVVLQWKGNLGLVLLNVPWQSKKCLCLNSISKFIIIYLCLEKLDYFIIENCNVKHSQNESKPEYFRISMGL